jgi:hypothetical protein
MLRMLFTSSTKLREFGGGVYIDVLIVCYGGF